jgi:hypothetical protein
MSVSGTDRMSYFVCLLRFAAFFGMLWLNGTFPRARECLCVCFTCAAAHEDEEAEAAASHSSDVSTDHERLHRQHPSPLPHGWETRVSRSSGGTYYFNTRTQEATYDLPVAVDTGRRHDDADGFPGDASMGSEEDDATRSAASADASSVSLSSWTHRSSRRPGQVLPRDGGGGGAVTDTSEPSSYTDDPRGQGGGGYPDTGRDGRTAGVGMLMTAAETEAMVEEGAAITLQAAFRGHRLRAAAGRQQQQGRRRRQSGGGTR